MAGPAVSVVVPAYNAVSYIGATLESVRAQSYQSWECVVVDDGSLDDTAEVARRFVERDQRFRVIQQANGGISAARNAGIAAVSPGGFYLAFLDADDVWLPDTLQVLIDAAVAHPGAVGVYGLAEYINEAGTPVRPGDHPSYQRDRRIMGRLDLRPLPAEAPTTFGSLVVSGTIWPSAVGLHRREVVDQVGGFDPDIAVTEDWDLYLRMSRLGDFVPIARQVAWYRRHDSNVTNGLENISYFVLLVRWKAWASSRNTAAQRRLMRRVWRRLLGRWVIWTTVAAIRATRARRWQDCRDALASGTTLTARLAVGHPTTPDRHFAEIVTRYVTARWTGLGEDGVIR
jgi:glycosyltransferase involved in cell wall biosynthesis